MVNTPLTTLKAFLQENAIKIDNVKFVASKRFVDKIAAHTRDFSRELAAK